MKFLIEGCVDSLASAEAALTSGADRLELCANLVIGGTTPSRTLFRQVKSISEKPVNVLIRPRFGDFLYSEAELHEMAEEIRAFRELGADGIVTGALRPDGALDIDAMEKLIGCAGELPVTLHRAFDMTPDAEAALEDAVSLGCAVILTSGQRESAAFGAALLKKLVSRAGERISIMAGGGVSVETVPVLADAGIRQFHASGKRTVDSGMVFRRSGVSMGLPSMSEYELWWTDEGRFRALADAVHGLGGATDA